MDNTQAIDSTSLSNFIWKIADDLWGDFKHTDFARIIIPFLLLRRLECVLEPTKELVLEQYKLEKDSDIDLSQMLPLFSGLAFYNTSEYSLDTLGSTKTLANLEEYISKFSGNVRIIFDEFGFNNTILELHKAGLLFRMSREFAKLDLHPDVISDRVMSNAYEDLIRQFAASINEKAGEFMTPKDVVRLSTKLILAPDEAMFSSDKGLIRSIYDPTCGLLGFITDAIDLITQLGSTAKIVPYGQELDPKTHAMALTAMLIRSYPSENIAQGSTLSQDLHPNKRFHYGLANPPFGIKWDKDKTAVLKEHELGYAGRFGPGLPRISDGSMLFLMHLVSKMELPENGGGRVGIVLSGSPLFTGDAGSGESEIRRYLLEQDLVEAIVALPTDMFFNTGIGTYVWVLSNHKTAERKNKVQLINLSNTWTAMRKSEGTKRRYLSDEQIDNVVREYADFEETDHCKIFNTTEFAYRKITIRRPLRAKLVLNESTISSLSLNKAFDKLSVEQQNAWIELFREQATEQAYSWAFEIVKAHHKTEKFGNTSKALANAFITTFMVRDEEAEPALDDKGEIIPDASLNDSESVPFDQPVEDYFKTEVLPHVPDAFIDFDVRDGKDGEVGIVGYEINFNRYFYEYVPPRALDEINADLKASEARIQALLDEVIE